MLGAERLATWRATVRLIVSAALVVFGARVVLLYFGYRTGGAVRAYHVESAALIFAALALAVRYLARRRNDTLGEPGVPAPAPRGVFGVLGAAFAAGSLALFGSAAGIGLLSDDYGLAARAAAWDLSVVTGTLFRPLPLFLWSILLNLGAGAVGLHLLNVVLHGVAAWLTARVCDPWMGRPWSLVAGLLFLASPLAVEPVVWCSGVFDVMATTCVLGSVLTARTYGLGSPTVRARALFAAPMLGAMFSKETAVVAPVLVAVDAWRLGRRSKALMIDLAAAAVLATVYGAVRMSDASHAVALDRYGLQRHLFAVFGMLALPLHIDLTAAGAPIATVTALIVSVTLFAIFGRSPDALRTVHTGLLWILIASAPAYGVLMSTPDLQGARYLYLAFAGWAAALVAMLSSLTTIARAMRPMVAAAIVALVALFAVAAVRHQQPWRRAAERRVLVQEEAVTTARLRRCDAVVLTDLPDSVSGAYLFRNSVAEAFIRERGLVVVDRVDRPECALRWNGERFE